MIINYFNAKGTQMIVMRERRSVIDLCRSIFIMPLVLTQKDLMYFFSVTTVDADKITSDQNFFYFDRKKTCHAANITFLS